MSLKSDTGSSKMLNENNKVLVIGVDAATWDLIEPWVKEDKLPMFQELMKNGVFGELESTVPPLTEPAWTSAFTGVNPGKHNIPDFISGFERRILTSRNLKTETIWQIIGKQDKKVILVNIPFTYPVEKVNGIMVTGMYTPGLKSDCTYPPELKHELSKKKYVIEVKVLDELRKNKDGCVKKLLDMTEKRKEIALNLMKENRWDLFVVVFVSIDRVQHFFWKDMESEHPKYGGVILRFYQQIDEIIKELIEEAGKQTNVIILSDHGFGPLRKYVYINNYLLHLGLLKLKEESKGRSLFQKIGVTKENFIKIGFTWIWKLLPDGIKKIKTKIPSITPYVEDIDWFKTKIYFYSEDGRSLRFNLKDRDPYGILREEETKDLTDFVIKKLYELKDPETKNLIVKKVYKKEEIYQGPYVHNAPDLVIELNDDYFGKAGFGEKLVMNAGEDILDKSAEHRMNGVFLAFGPDIKKGFEIKKSKIYDVAPTILHMLGSPVPEGMDGRVLKEIFTENSRFFKRDVTYLEKDESEKIREKIMELKLLRKI
jgi:predicted AlkP superfamily phosphohydrolase/phosphomutase